MGKKKCGHNMGCGCEDQPLVTPPPCGQGTANCPDPEPCEETFRSECGIWTTDDLTCNSTVIATTGDRLNIILERLTALACEPGPPGPAGPQGPMGPQGPAGPSSDPLVIFRRLAADLDFDSEPSLSTSGIFTLPFNTVSNIPTLNITIPQFGDYLVHLDFSLYSTYDLAINFRVNLNNLPLADSVKGVLVDGATPPIHTHTYTLDYALSSLDAGDIVKIDFKTVSTSSGDPSPGNTYIIMASLTLTKIDLN